MMSSLKRAKREQDMVASVYKGMKVIRNQLSRVKSNVQWNRISVQKFYELSNDWQEYKINTNQEIKRVPIVMMEIESIDTLIFNMRNEIKNLFGLMLNVK